VVRSLVETGKVSYEGEFYRVKAQLQVPHARPFPILIGGLGERMRRVAGRVADGTLTWMTGKRTLRDVLIPDIKAAAEAAGRAAPRIVAALPIVLTEDREAARERVSQVYATYPSLPSYRAMLDLEGAKRGGDIAIIGSEAEIERELGELADAGVTDLNAAAIGVGDDRKSSAARTYALLSDLARRES
jgi:alkanesulfonate monooxygenase SsuD/methylene tetrahydromethanopterin reductase-like flavin-dependent oxidoreductase (luciferase family)